MAGGFVEAGYGTIHLDDCIVDKVRGAHSHTHECALDCVGACARARARAPPQLVVLAVVTVLDD